MSAVGHDAKLFWDQLRCLEGDEAVLAELMPILDRLVIDLISLSRSQYGPSLLPLFEWCIFSVNALTV